MDEVFAPPGARWHPVSPALALARRLVLLMVMGALALVGLTAALLLSAPVGLAAAGTVLWLGALVWAWWLIGRRVASFGYAERDEDLLITSGILKRRLVVVPYGRMQLVDVVAGPVDRALGIAAVKLHTAAASTEAVIPGLEPGDAAGLRDRLAARGESRSAGL